MRGKARCLQCDEDIVSPEKPYFSKQAAMEGVYHWRCFIEACHSRMPDSLIPASGSGSTYEGSSYGDSESEEDD